MYGFQVELNGCSLVNINFIYCQPNGYKFRTGTVHVLKTEILRPVTRTVVITHGIRFYEHRWLL